MEKTNGGDKRGPIVSRAKENTDSLGKPSKILNIIIAKEGAQWWGERGRGASDRESRVLVVDRERPEGQRPRPMAHPIALEGVNGVLEEV